MAIGNITSAVVDRTKVFHEIADQLEKTAKLKSPGINVSREKPKKSSFSAAAEAISNDIRELDVKLQKLEKMASARSIFEDCTVEFQELTFIVRKGLTTVASQLEKLGQILNGTISDNGAVINNDQWRNHCAEVHKRLEYRLSKVTGQFRNVLQTRSENLKQQQERRRQFTGAPSATLADTNVDLFENDILRANDSGDVSISMPTADQLQVRKSVDHSAQRLEAIQSIESSLTEVQGLMQYLATEIAVQENMVVRIDENLEESQHNVQIAQNNLLQMLQGVSSNRSLIIRMFFVLVTTIVLFFIFFI